MPDSGKSTSRRHRLRQVLTEYESRKDGDFPLTPEELIADHPDLAAELRDHFGLRERRTESERPTTSVGLAGPSSASDDEAAAETIAPRRRNAASNALPTERHFGRYVLERQLGRGAMGAVFLARDTELGRNVALKIPTFSPEESEYRERFYREARAAAVLSHANLCQVFDIGEHEGKLFITMTLIDGQPLSRHIGLPRFTDERFIARLIRKIALAIQHAHENGIIHRDLKPGNILIDKKGEPFVTDFGLARKLDSGAEDRLTQEGTIVGTPAYMSAEQIEDGARKVGPRSDIYSLGVILYEMLTGELPFTGPVMAVIGKILRDRPKPPSALKKTISPQLESICLKMMARSADNRFGSMKEVADALAAFIREAKTDVIPAEKPMPNRSDEKPLRPRSARRPVGKKPAPAKKGRKKESGPPAIRGASPPRAMREESGEFFLHVWAFEKAKEHWKILAGSAATTVVGMILWSLVSSLLVDTSPDSSLAGPDRAAEGSETAAGSGTEGETLAAGTGAERTGTDELAAGEVSLFNGRDLTGWKVSGNAEWRAENKVLISDAGLNGVLWTGRSYSDFELRFRFKLSEGANSGIYLRSPDQKMTRGSDQLEIQLLDDPQFATQPPHGRTGAIFGIRPPAFRAYRPDRWNDVTIRMAGRMIEVQLNGHEIQNASLDNVTGNFSERPGLKREGGFIGIQSYGAGANGSHRIEFSDIRIVDLTALPAVNPVRKPSLSEPKTDWAIPTEFTDARPLESLNRDQPVNAYASLSEDGLDIYWTREGGGGLSEIRTASRPRVGVPFGASRKLATGRHGVVAKNGCYLMYLRSRGAADFELVESFRASRFDKFDPPQPVFTEIDQPKGPSLSIDGKTVVFQKTAAVAGRTQLQIAMRSRYDLSWAGPWTLRLAKPEWVSDPLTWPFLSEDRLTLLVCHGSGRNARIVKASRTDETHEFDEFQSVRVDGLDLNARAPFYVYQTRELFYSVPVSNPAGSWELWSARAR